MSNMEDLKADVNAAKNQYERVRGTGLGTSLTEDLLYKALTRLANAFDEEVEQIDIVFSHCDPSQPDLHFVEVENGQGQGIRAGEWVNREDGYTVLRLPHPKTQVPDNHEKVKDIESLAISYCEKNYTSPDGKPYCSACLTKAQLAKGVHRV